jgi:hypothetical protein
LVDSRGLIEVPLQLQRDGFAEQRGGVIGLLLQHLVEAFRRGVGFFQMQQRDAEPQPRVQPVRLRFGRLFEEIAASCQRPSRSRQTARFRFALACLGCMLSSLA